MSVEAQIKRLQYLATMMSKYREAYSRGMKNGWGLSPRMYRWIDEYDDMRHTTAWAEYCRIENLSQRHVASDNFA